MHPHHAAHARHALPEGASALPALRPPHHHHLHGHVMCPPQPRGVVAPLVDERLPLPLPDWFVEEVEKQHHHQPRPPPPPPPLPPLPQRQAPSWRQVQGSPPLQPLASQPGPQRVESVEQDAGGKAARLPVVGRHHAVTVFKGHVGSRSLHEVTVAAPATVADLSKAVQALFGLPTYKQTLVALGSPSVRVFDMGCLPVHKAATIPLPTNCSFLLQAQHPDSRQAAEEGQRTWEPVSVGTPAVPKTKAVPASAFQEEVREQLTFALHTKHNGVTLQRMAEECPFSTAALSMWRRGVYRGNTLAVAKAVKAALQRLVPGAVFSMEESAGEGGEEPVQAHAHKRRRLSYHSEGVAV